AGERGRRSRCFGPEPEPLPGSEPASCKEGRVVEASRGVNRGRAAMTTKETFVGIDVAKAHLDYAFDADPAVARVTNDEAGIAQLTQRLRAAAPTLVVLEATGGY